jgi:hypothetical protein
MKNSTIAFLFVLLTLCTFGQAKEKKSKNNEREVSAGKLVGTWKLIEFSNLDTVANGWSHPYGKNPNGYFSYSKKGIVNINISSEIPLQIPKDSVANFAINLNTFRQNYAVGYFGTYTVDIEKQIVIHHVKGGTIPEYINTDQARPFILKNDTLVIGDIKTWKRVLVKVD